MRSQLLFRLPSALTAVGLLAGLPFSSGALASEQDIVLDLGRGPITVTVPSSYSQGTPLPLILVLHGYGGSAAGIENYWQMSARAEEYEFFVAHPEGTVGQNGLRFWNATDACCNFWGSTVDDSQYLLDLINEISSQVDVDPQRVHVCGHSNGGFMSYRMACDHSGTIAAIASLAGATWADPADCSPDSPVHVLQIHGTSDDVIFYNGGNFGGNDYPGAIETVEYWGGVAGCTPIPDANFPPLDIDASLPGAETTVWKYTDDCHASGTGELWTIVDGEHSPNFNSTFSQLLVEYLLAHPQPDAAGVSSQSLATIEGLSCSPNPFSSSTSIQLRLEVAASVSVRILAATGRRIRILAQSRSLPAGSHFWSWDGRGDGGATLPSGVYFVHVTLNGHRHSTRVVQLDG